MSTTLQSALSESKQKVTLYLSPDLHHHLKIRAAVEAEAMSALAERALRFYLDHPDVVDGALGSTHQVYHCPECTHPFVMKHGDVHSLPNASEAVVDDQELSSWEIEKALVSC